MEMGMQRAKRIPGQPGTVAEAVLELCFRWGARRIYGVAGDAILPFLAALRQFPDIQYIGARHEAAAAMMASAESKLTGRFGVCTATSGPGIANLLNGLADAAADRVPVLAITGQVPTAKIGTGGKQDLEQQQLMAPIAVYSATLFHPEAAAEMLLRAIVTAIERKGVSHVAIPKDLWHAPWSGAVKSPLGVLVRARQRELEQLATAVQWLQSAARPMMLIGEGARGATAEIIQLSERLSAGVIETLGGKGVVPYDHPYHAGGIGEGGTMEGSRLLAEADCILVIGANWYPQGYTPRSARQRPLRLIQIDAQAAHIELHPVATCGLVGDAKEVLALLLKRMEQGEGAPNRNRWVQRLQEAKRQIVEEQDRERQLTGHPVPPQRVLAALDEMLDEDAIVTVDTGDHTVWFNRLFRAKRQEILYSGKWRTMGYALPAAISAKLANPERQVVALVGDGSFAMTGMELGTAVAHQLPIVVVILNNRLLGKEYSMMLAQGVQPFGVSLTNPDFAALARAFGAEGIRVEREDALSPALSAALHGHRHVPVVLDVICGAPVPPLAKYQAVIPT